jgi:hypothetical protein
MKLAWPNINYHPGICLEALSKKKIRVAGLQDLNPGLPGYEVGRLNIRM